MEVLWQSENFSVNASNETHVTLDARNLSLQPGGTFALHYMKRVIDSAQWVHEPIDAQFVEVVEEQEEGWLPYPSAALSIFCMIVGAIYSKSRRNTPLSVEKERN
jgi:hypothetical protein